MSHLRQLVAEIQLHLLEEYPPEQWLMTDATTYQFFKERAVKKKPSPPPAQPQAIPPKPPQPMPVAKKPAPPTTIAPPLKTPTAAVEPAKFEPPTAPSRSFQLTPPPPAPTTDPSALKSLLAQVAPQLALRDTTATKEELAIPPQVLILCPKNTPATHRTVLDNLCKAITRTWMPCELADPSSPEGAQLLASPLKLVVAEGEAPVQAPFLSIVSIEALLLNPQSKIALWKELTARLAP